MKLATYALTLSLFIFHVAANAIDHQTDIKACDEEGNTLLHQTTNIETARYLLEQGVNVNARNKYGCTFLTYAAISNSLDLVTLALHFGADVNTQNNDGITPLMNATLTGNLAIIKLLINHDADVTLRDQENRTALDYAKDFILANPSFKADMIRNYLIQQYKKQNHIKDEL